MRKTSAYAAATNTSPLALTTIERRELGSSDVAIDIQYCGVCHSDLHTARGEWEDVVFPVVPGHEIVGKVKSVGNAVTRFKVGDVVGVGVMVGSCRRCENCASHLEQYCNDKTIFTYNTEDPHLPGRMTYGGYSKHIVVDQHFVLHIRETRDFAAVAPLLCAGITLYSPLKHFGAGPGKKVGIVGLGGLGHMGVKIAHALGARTSVFTTSRGKAEDAKRLGADAVVLSTDEAAMAREENTFDLIVDTIAASHELDPYAKLLRRDGTLCLLGVPPSKHPAIDVGSLLMKRRRIAGSIIGGLSETQEMLDFCAAKGIVADIEKIPIDRINDAYERMSKGDVKYRFVIDMASLPD